jgi:hypothetical protein
MEEFKNKIKTELEKTTSGFTQVSNKWFIYVCFSSSAS